MSNKPNKTVVEEGAPIRADEETMKLADEWLADCRDRGIVPAEVIGAASHVLYDRLCQVPTLDRAMLLLTEVYSGITQKLLRHKFKGGQ